MRCQHNADGYSCADCWRELHASRDAYRAQHDDAARAYNAAVADLASARAEAAAMRAALADLVAGCSKCAYVECQEPATKMMPYGRMCAAHGHSGWPEEKFTPALRAAIALLGTEGK